VLIILAFCPLIDKIAISVGDNKVEFARVKASTEYAAKIEADKMGEEIK
jgi:hypothetical protein